LAPQDKRLTDMMNVVPLDQLLPYSSRCVAVAFAYERVFEAELRESLKSVASKKCTVALNGIVEFGMFSEPPLPPEIGFRSNSMRDGFSQTDAKNELPIDFEN
jgi:hypothetical protein